MQKNNIESNFRDSNYDEKHSGSSNSEKDHRKKEQKNHLQTDEDEMGDNDADRMMMHKTPSQDIFYKNGRM